MGQETCSGPVPVGRADTRAPAVEPEPSNSGRSLRSEPVDRVTHRSTILAADRKSTRWTCPPLSEVTPGRVVVVDGTLVPTSNRTGQTGLYGGKATTRREHPDSVRPGRSPPGCLRAPSRIRARPPSNRSIRRGVITRLDADSRPPRLPRNIRRHAQPETTPPTTLARKRGHQPPPRPAPNPRGTRRRSPEELENPRHRIPRPPRRAFQHHPHHHRAGVLPPRLESVVNNARVYVLTLGRAIGA